MYLCGLSQTINDKRNVYSTFPYIVISQYHRVLASMLFEIETLVYNNYNNVNYTNNDF